jgi:hypothetical protein
MLSSPTTDIGKILSILHGLHPSGGNHFSNGIKVAMVGAERYPIHRRCVSAAL